MSTGKEPAVLHEGGVSPLRRGRGLRLALKPTQPVYPPLQPLTYRKLGATPTEYASTTDIIHVPTLDPPDNADSAPTTEIPDSCLALPIDANWRDSQTAEQASFDDWSTQNAPINIELDSKRVKRGIRLRKDLLRACKRLARAQNRKLNQVIESALEDYIRRQETSV